MQATAVSVMSEPTIRQVNGNDCEAMRQLETNVGLRLSGHVRGFRIELHEQGLVLRGSSRSFYAKQLAQHAVMRSTGIRIVRNLIEVAATNEQRMVVSLP
jgi:hypothetical protein